MVKVHSDSKKRNLLLHLMNYSFQLAARDLLYTPTHKQDIHTTAFVTLVVEHRLEQELGQLKTKHVSAVVTVYSVTS